MPVSAPVPVSAPAAAGRAPAWPGPGYQRGNVSEHSDVYPYAVYVPSSLRADSAAPLVVVLHGCGMTADQMAAASQFDALAERDRFMVLYPDVDALDAETYGRCWRGIWAPDLEGRGSGDAAAIADHDQGRHQPLARRSQSRLRDRHLGGRVRDRDPRRLLPGPVCRDRHPFGRTVHGSRAGVPSGRREHGRAGARRAGRDGRAGTGDAGHRHPRRRGPRGSLPVRTAGHRAVARRRQPGPQARNAALGLPGSPAASRSAVVPGGHGYTVLSYADGSGCVVAQLWTVHGMGHYWSGGSADPASQRYSDSRGPSAAAASWAFFSRWGLSGPLRPCARAG